MNAFTRKTFVSASNPYIFSYNSCLITTSLMNELVFYLTKLYFVFTKLSFKKAMFVKGRH